MDHLQPPPPPPNSWTVMEARLSTAKVHDLLDRAASELRRLSGADGLPMDIAAAISTTLREIEDGRQRIGTARRRLAGQPEPPAPEQPGSPVVPLTAVRFDETA